MQGADKRVLFWSHQLQMFDKFWNLTHIKSIILTDSHFADANVIDFEYKVFVQVFE